MYRQEAPPPIPDVKPAEASPTDRAKSLTKPFGADPELERWAARMLASADDFQKRKRSDPLGVFLPTHKR